MRIVLHIGLPKTGSTSIQAALSESRAQLKEQGVFYPRVGFYNNQNALSLAFQSKRLNRTFRRRFRGNLDRARAYSERVWARIEKEVQSAQPEVLILSGEYFFSLDDPERLVQRLHRAFPSTESIQVFAYLRRPSEHYLSLVQQSLKASHRFRAPKRQQYAKKLEPFGYQANLTLREMHRDTLLGGNVVRDFLAQALPGLGDQMEISSGRRNTSISAEGMVLLQRYRHNFYPDQNQVFNYDTQRLLEAIRQVERRHEGGGFFTKPVLRTEVARYIDYSTPDNARLEKNLGFSFRDLTGGRVGREVLRGKPFKTVEDLLIVDKEKAETLGHLVGKRLNSPTVHLRALRRALSGLGKLL